MVALLLLAHAAARLKKRAPFCSGATFFVVVFSFISGVFLSQLSALLISNRGLFVHGPSQSPRSSALVPKSPPYHEQLFYDELSKELNTTPMDAVSRETGFWQKNHFRIMADYLRVRLKSLNVSLVDFGDSQSLDPQKRTNFTTFDLGGSSHNYECPFNQHFFHDTLDPSTPKTGRKVYDVFPFLDEFELLELRLGILDPVVDEFVIIQCPYTFMNASVPIEPRPQDVESISKYAHKIRNFYCDLSKFPFEGKSPWPREFYIRNVTLKAVIDEAGPEDIVMFSDLDEIPKPNVVHMLRTNESFHFPAVIHSPLYKFSFGCLDRSFNAYKQWPSNVVTLGRLLKEKARLHEDGYIIRKKLREERKNIIMCGGWHCNSFVSPQVWVHKVSSNSHAAELNENWWDPHFFEVQRASCRYGFWQRSRNWQGLPRHVLENHKRYDYIMPK